MLGLKTSLGILPSKTLAELLMDQAIVLNNAPGGDNFTRATSAYDPYHNVIAAPGVRRRRSYNIGRYRAVGPDLIEGAATNLLAAGSSEGLQGWSLGGGTLTGGASGAPDGSSTAAILKEDTSTGTHVASQSVTFVNGQSYTISCYVTPSAARQVYLSFNSGVFLTGANAWFDCNAGTVAGHGVAATNYGIVKEGALWHIWVTAVAQSSAATNINIALYNGGISYTGTNQQMTIAWCQCINSTFPTSYISNRNLILHSQVFSSGWTPTRATVAALSIALPDGSTGGYSLTEDTTASNNHVILATTLSATNGQTFTYTAWVKRNTGTRNIQIQPLIVSNGASFNFDLGAGTTGTNAGIGSTPFTSLSSTITAIGNFYQCSATFTVATTGTLSPYLFMLNGTTSTYTGDGSSSLALWRAQIEYGTSATSYWGTHATVGGRDADALAATYTLGTAAGTLLALVIPYGWNGDTGSAYRIFDASNINLIRNNATSLNFNINDTAGLKTASGITHGFAIGALNQIAAVWDSTSARAYVKGVANGTPSATPTLPFLATTSLEIGSQSSSPGAQSINGWVAVLAFPRVLAASELLAIETALPVAA